MTIDKIDFKQGEEGAIPSQITVTMTLAELVWIADKAGTTPGDYPVVHDIYNTLASDVMNRYWEDGIEGARKEPAK